ncbi:MAG: ATP-binding protein [Flavobacteriaceae bacterium]|nr:ATP-binding protein [Flavobacteriaceae bacterium]
MSLSEINHNNEPHLKLSVKDAGIGIPDEQRKHIFDRFYQVDNSATRSQQGTGIGLSLVKELVHLQNGSIEVFSEVGKGTIPLKFCSPYPIKRKLNPLSGSFW